MRVAPDFSATGPRGSQKWLIRAVNDRPEVLFEHVSAVWPDIRRIDWRSPLAEDDWAEYRDAAFLDRIGLSAHANALGMFWPTRGPQWDGLAVFEGADGEGVLLVEAKAHLAEAESPGTQAQGASLERIEAALGAAAAAFGAPAGSVWHKKYYQYANRLAHLHFLRSRGADTRLLFVDFVGDAEMGGPSTPDGWHAATREIETALGVAPRRAGALRGTWAHVHPKVGALT